MRFVPGRHDVGMAREGEARGTFAKPRPQILDHRQAGTGEGKAFDNETCACKKVAQIAERARVRRRHRAKANQIARNVKRGRSTHCVSVVAFRALTPPIRAVRRRWAVRCWRATSKGPSPDRA